jgi:hypothetical protein
MTAGTPVLLIEFLVSAAYRHVVLVGSTGECNGVDSRLFWEERHGSDRSTGIGPAAKTRIVGPVESWAIAQ